MYFLSVSISFTTDSKPFHCTYCRKEFSHLSSLESHLEHMHAKDSKHACEACGKSFSSKSNLTAHKKIHSGEDPARPGSARSSTLFTSLIVLLRIVTYFLCFPR